MLNGCGTGEHEETPVIQMENPFRTTPNPRDKTLHLQAEADDCSGADSKVEDVEVQETPDEVIVDASLRVEDINSLDCEIRTVGDDFDVRLERPLGERLVIDNAQAKGTVIWSPQRRKDILRRLQVDSSDAEALIRSKLPAAQNTSCSGNRGKYFACTV